MTGMGQPAAQIANVDVFLILADDRGRLLLGLRAPQLWAGGQWNLVSGKADEGEDVLTAVCREAAEEAGLRLTPDDVEAAAVVHYRYQNDRPRVGFGFRVRYDAGRHGPVVNAEPHKCDALGWFAPDELPYPLEPYNRAVLDAAAGDRPFVAVGWQPSEAPAGSP
jgi:8-oxo-dGTP diphosphatase